MISSIKHWFTAPVFAGDEEKTHRASLLHAVILVVFFLTLFVIPGNILAGNTPLRNYIIDFMILVCVAFFRWLLQRGHVRAVSQSIMILGCAFMGAMIISEASILVPATSGLILLVVVSGILFDATGIVLATLVSSAMIGCIAYAQTNGLLPHLEDHVTVIHWFVYSLFYAATGGLSYFVYRSQQRALELARTELVERERVQLELRKLTRAVEQSPASIVITDTTGAIEYVNPRFTQVTGYSSAEALGQNPRILKTSLTPTETHRQLWDALAAGKEWQGEFVNRKKDGTQFVELAHISPITNQNGVITHYLAVKEDFTARKQAEDQLQEAHTRLEQRVQERTAELQKANLSLERASRAKDEFLSMMSHELRTPLNGILGLSQLLQMKTYGSLSEKQLGAVQNIEKSGERLHKLVNTILDYSSLQSGKTDLLRQSYSLVSMCKANLHELRKLFEGKNQQISFVAPEELIINADEQRLTQIINILLDNAIKFTPQGGSISLTLSADPLARQARINVRDNGIGIQEKDLPHLFQPFTQLDTRLAREFEGAGMSLALVKLLVDLHGGSVEVSSAPGDGSCFTVILPWQAE